MNEFSPHYMYRYLLLEMKFVSPEEGNRVLKSLSPKSLVSLIKDAVLTLHGDFGLACVLHSLNGEYCPSLMHIWYFNGCPCATIPVYLAKASEVYIMNACYSILYTHTLTHSEIYECADTLGHPPLSKGQSQGCLVSRIYHHPTQKGSVCVSALASEWYHPVLPEPPH